LSLTPQESTHDTFAALVLRSIVVALFCTFCNSPLDGSVEHILLSALGGRKTSAKVICSTHNNAFGSTIDLALSSQLTYFSNILAIKTGRREDAPTLRNVMTVNNQRVDVLPGGRMVAKTRIESAEPTQVDGQPPSTERTIRISASSSESLKRLIPVYLKRYKKTAGDLKDAIAVERLEPGALINFTISLGDEPALRCVAKMGLLLLASAIGTEQVRGDDTAGLRKFILDGSGDWDGLRLDFETEFEMPAAHAALPAYCHRIGVVADPSAGLAYAQVQLFGAFRYSVILSERWAGSAVGLQYAVDPVTGTGGDERVTAKAAVTATEIKARSESAEDIGTRCRTVWGAVRERSNAILIDEVINESMASAFAGLKEGDEICAEVIGRLAEQVAMRFFARTRGVPFETPIDVQQLVGDDKTKS